MGEGEDEEGMKFRCLNRASPRSPGSNALRNGRLSSSEGRRDGNPHVREEASF